MQSVELQKWFISACLPQAKPFYTFSCKFNHLAVWSIACTQYNNNTWCTFSLFWKASRAGRSSINGDRNAINNETARPRQPRQPRRPATSIWSVGPKGNGHWLRRNLNTVHSFLRCTDDDETKRRNYDRLQIATSFLVHHFLSILDKI